MRVRHLTQVLRGFAFVVVVVGASACLASSASLAAGRLGGSKDARVCLPTAREVSTPTTPRAFLWRIAVAPDGDVWTVGSTDRELRGVILRLVRGRFVRIQVPRGVEELRDVVALDRNDAWAVGMNAVLHWDGRSWRRSAAPAGSYWGVSAAASDDVWAVGTGRGLLVAHWDGTTWTRVPFLPLPAENEQPIAGGDTFLAFSYLEAVLALGPDDVWVSGDSGKTDWGIAAHWDGTSWAAHPLHAVDADLGSLAQDSTGHIWASGGIRGGGIIAEWNGKVWRVRAKRYWIPDVAARGTEIWAILDVVARWNRTGWMPLEKRHPDFTLYGLAADRHGNAWAAGFYLGDKPKQRAVVYRWTACAA